MATVPALVGACVGGIRWEHALLLVGWVAGFLFFNAAGSWMTARRRPARRARYVPALLTWGAVSAAAGVSAVALAPGLLAWAVLFLPLVAVAFVEAWRGRGRSLASRLSAVLACGLTCAVSYDWATGPAWRGLRASVSATTAGAGDGAGGWPWRDAGAMTAAGPGVGWAHAWIVTAVLTAYFVGTVPYVRSLIRERGSVRWIAGSVAWSAVSAAGALAAWDAGAVSWAVPVVSVLLIARAAAVPWDQARRGPWRPLAIGLGEIAATALVAATLLLPV